MIYIKIKNHLISTETELLHTIKITILTITKKNLEYHGSNQVSNSIHKYVEWNVEMCFNSTMEYYEILITIALK